MKVWLIFKNGENYDAIIESEKDGILYEEMKNLREVIQGKFILWGDTEFEDLDKKSNEEINEYFKKEFEKRQL